MKEVGPGAPWEEMAEWLRKGGHPENARVFSVAGCFPGVRKALLARDWVENSEPGSGLWHLKYALWQKDIGELSKLRPEQVSNYFARNNAITTKCGLFSHLYAREGIDCDSFYPRCYDLSDAGSLQSSPFSSDTAASALLGSQLISFRYERL